MKVIKFLLLLLILFPCPVVAQNAMTSSPYSMFGVGEINSGLSGQNAAMGGVAYGVRNPMLINTDNPAGLVGMDSCKLIAEASAFVKSESYRSNGNTNNTFIGNISGFMVGGRIMPRWYAAASLTPYSSVGYYFKNDQEIEGAPGTTVSSVFEGSGGLSKVSLSNALLLPGNLSVGANLSYVFGNMKQVETQEAMSVTQHMEARTFYADFGIQFQRQLNRNALLILGAVYGYQQKLNINHTMAVATSTTLTETSPKNADQYLPQFFGFGGSLTYKRFSYALDYSYHQYSVLTSGDSRITFNDTHELRSGVCYAPAGYSSSSYWKRMKYKAGLRASSNYLSISGKDGLLWRVSAGIEFPVRNGKINTALFYESLKLQDNKLQSTTMGVTVSYTISELFYRIKL